MALKSSSSQAAGSDPVRETDVRVRPLAHRDIQPILDYYYRSAPGFPGTSGFDFEKFPKEAEYRLRLEQRAMTANQQPFLIVEFRGQPIGFHLLNNLTDDQAEFHAHFWDAKARGRGIGAISGYLACRYFFSLMPNLQRLVFRPPKDNPFSTRLARKMPLKYLGEEIIDSPILKPGIKADVYALTRVDFDKLNSTDADSDDLEEDL